MYVSVFSGITRGDRHLHSTAVQPDTQTLSPPAIPPPLVAFGDSVSRYRHVFGTAIRDPILLQNPD